MTLIDYIHRGGSLVYVLIILNIIGFSIIGYKLFSLNYVRKRINKIVSVFCMDYNRDDEVIIENKINSFINGLYRGISTIRIIATISPLIGLLGTVVGVLKSFDQISRLGLSDPSIFSRGISIALITTAAGLVVAIPHYIAYNYLISYLDRIELLLQEKVIEKLSQKK